MRNRTISCWLFLILFTPLSCTQESKSARNNFGEVEVDELAISSRLPGRIKKILVTPGQKVKAGDTLIEFEDDVLSAKKQGALAMIKAAESQRDLAQDAVRPEIKAQLNAAAAATKKQMDFAKTSLDRMHKLLLEGAVSKQAVDEVEMKYQTAVEAHKAATAGMGLAAAGSRKEEKISAQALVDQSKTVLAEIEALEKDMSLKSPIDAEVFEILNQEGELVPMGYPVLTVIKLDKPWITMNVPETNLPMFPMNKDVDITIPALNKQVFKGKVSFISAMANFATKAYTQDRSNFDLKTFEVRITLAAKNSEELRPGMTAIVSTK